MIRHLAGDTARYVPALLIPIGMGALQTMVFARIATAAQLGTFLLVSAIATSLGGPASTWLRQAVLRFYQFYVNDGRQASYLAIVTLLGVMAGGLTGAIVAALMALGLGGSSSGLAYAAPAALIAFFTVANTSRTAVLQASFAVGSYSTLTSAAAVGRLAVPLLLLPVMEPTGSLLWGTALVSVATFVATTALTNRATHADAVDGRSHAHVGQVFRESMQFGVPLTISDVGQQVLDYSDRYMIAGFLGAAAVGLYSANYSIAEKLITLAQGPLIYAAHPRIVAVWESGDEAGARRLIATATQWLLLLGLPLVAFTVVRSQLVSWVILGNTYTSGNLVIPVAGVGVLVGAISQYGHKSLELARDTVVITVGLLVAAVVNVIAVVLLTMAIGYMGGAIATVVGFTAYAALIYFLTRRRGAFRWDPPWQTLRNGLLAAGCAGVLWALATPPRITTFWDVLSLISGGLLGLGVYGILLALFGEIPLSRENVARARAWIGRTRRTHAPASSHG